MRLIKKIEDVDFSTQDQIQFLATVLDLQDQGQEDLKRPMRFNLKLEESGEVITAISWNFAILETIKDLSKSAEVAEFEAMAGTFRDQQQFRVGNMRLTGKESIRKIVRKIDVAQVKREIQTLVNKYVKTPIVKDIIDEFVLNNSKFFQWPAATKVHHAYEGGLAVHSLAVANHVVSMWNIYQGQMLDIEILVAGALIHDIGKLYEYNKDGSKTTFGSLVSHLVSGAEEVAKFCFSKGIDSNRDTKVLMLKHILLSHHSKMEYGAATTPAILEAVMVARADEIDATYESLVADLINTETGTFTEKQIVLDGDKLLKWY